MRKKLISVILAATLLLTMAVTLVAQEKTEVLRPNGTPGGKAPEFKLKDLAGVDVSMPQDFTKKKVVILVFSTTWCHYCLEEIPALKAAYDKYKGKGVEVIAVDPQESKERVQELVAKNNITYPVLLDEKGDVARLYKIMGVPTIIFLDQARVIKWRSSGGQQDYDSRLQEMGIR